MSGVLRCVLLGAPGVGKGTYGKALSAKFGIPLIGAGDLIRDEIRAKTTLGREFEDYSNRGQLAPDVLVCDVISKRLSDSDVQSQGFMLDGFPRTVPQAEILGSWYPINLVLYLKLKREEYLVAKLLGRRVCLKCGKSFNVADVINESEDVSMPALLPSHGNPTRCECGTALSMRADDTEEVIKERLNVYNVETTPLVDYYRYHGGLSEFTILRGLDDLPRLEKLFQARIESL